MAKAAKTLPPQDPLTAGRRALHKRRNAAQDRRDALGLLGRVVVLAAAAWVLFTQVFLLTQASGNSMFPAVKDGDLLIGYRLQGTYAKNDVVLYEHDGKLRVGRVLGRENDLIALDDSGTLIVNGSAQSGEILYPTYATPSSTPTPSPRTASSSWETTARNPRTAGILARWPSPTSKQR